MKFRWPWQRRAVPRKPAGTPTKGGSEDSNPPNERSWFGSSIDLQDGLKVVEDSDVTIPGDLGPADRRRTPRNGSGG
jgi:hypothetical protein